MNELLVRRGGDEVPFSRGILSRSLLRLGLDATRAYDIATHIADDLRGEGVALVTSQHLARILSTRIAYYAGPEFGERYEKLRLLKRSPRPLVLLVGGSTGSGKSTVATEVAHRLDITRIQSTDSIRHVMRSVISRNLLPCVHRSSFEVDPQAPTTSTNPHVAALSEQVRYVSVAVEAVLERALQESLSTILEGVHLVPGGFQRFASNPGLHFVHVIIHVGEEATHQQRFLQRGSTVATRPSQRYLDNFTTIRGIQKHLVERAEATGVPCIENHSLDDAVHEVLGHILDGVGESTPIVPPGAPALADPGT